MIVLHRVGLLESALLATNWSIPCAISSLHAFVHATLRLQRRLNRYRFVIQTHKVLTMLAAAAP
jgi:hypothetical protein